MGGAVREVATQEALDGLGKLQFAEMLSFACGCGEWSVTSVLAFPVIFQSWGQKLRRVKWQSCLTRS